MTKTRSAMVIFIIIITLLISGCATIFSLFKKPITETYISPELNGLTKGKFLNASYKTDEEELLPRQDISWFLDTELPATFGVLAQKHGFSSFNASLDNQGPVFSFAILIFEQQIPNRYPVEYSLSVIIKLYQGESVSAEPAGQLIYSAESEDSILMSTYSLEVFDEILASLSERMLGEK